MSETTQPPRSDTQNGGVSFGNVDGGIHNSQIAGHNIYNLGFKPHRIRSLVPNELLMVDDRIQYSGGIEPEKRQFELIVNGKRATDPCFERGLVPCSKPVVNSQGQAVGWYISSRAVAGYLRKLSRRQVWLARWKGWKLKAELHLQAGIAFVNVELGSTRYDMHVHFTENRTPCFYLVNYIRDKNQADAKDITLDPGILGKTPSLREPGYHEFTLDYDASSKAASLSIDGIQRTPTGVELASDYTGHKSYTSESQLGWGVAGRDRDPVGKATFKWIDFEIKK